jgi:hypothetical protein
MSGRAFAVLALLVTFFGPVALFAIGEPIAHPAFVPFAFVAFLLFLMSLLPERSLAPYRGVCVFRLGLVWALLQPAPDF